MRFPVIRLAAPGARHWLKGASSLQWFEQLEGAQATHLGKQFAGSAGGRLHKWLDSCAVRTHQSGRAWPDRNKAAGGIRCAAPIVLLPPQAGALWARPAAADGTVSPCSRCREVLSRCVVIRRTELGCLRAGERLGGNWSSRSARSALKPLRRAAHLCSGGQSAATARGAPLRAACQGAACTGTPNWARCAGEPGGKSLCRRRVLRHRRTLLRRYGVSLF